MKQLFIIFSFILASQLSFGQYFINNRLNIGGSDVQIGTNDGRDKGTKTLQRALVHYPDGYWNGRDALHINFTGDFEAGVRIGGPGTVIDGRLGLGTKYPSAKLHIMQLSPDHVGGMRLEDKDGSDWRFYVNTYNDFNFNYEGYSRSYISDQSGIYYQYSDKRLKNNIEKLEDVLERVMQLNPSTYYYNNVKLDKGEKPVKSYGFIAQEVQEIFPDFVQANEKDTLAIAYDNFGVISIKGIQELKIELDEKEELIADLQQQINNLLERFEKLENLPEQRSNTTSIQLNNEPQQARLEQNLPNPLTTETTINYFIPNNTKKAELYFIDGNGRTIKTIEINATGKGNINISALNLANGIYHYTLILDGKMFQSKKMIVNK